MIKNLVFDVGNVLFDYRWLDMLCDYGVSRDEAYRIFMEMEEQQTIWTDMDIDLVPIDEILHRYEELFPADIDVIRWFLLHGEYMHVARPKVWRMIHALKTAGYKIYLLSNYSEDLFTKHTQYADFMKDIDGKMVSFMVHEVKPNAPIYEALFETYGIDPKESFFFDDRLENIEKGRTFGMDGFLVESQEALIAKLETYLPKVR